MAEGNTKAPGNSEFNIDSFFGSLERQVNGSVFDAEPDNKGKKVEDEKSDSKGTEDVGTLKAELETLKKRYEDSSKEAKRLYSELQQVKEYSDYVPILEAMRNDPGLINHVKSYLDGTGSQVPEDFDPMEAFSNPNSTSAKYLQSLIDSRAQSIVNQKLTETTGKLSQKEMIRDFQSKHKLSDDEMNELLSWGNSTPFTLDDLLYLKNKGKNEEAVAKRTQEEIQKQLAKMKDVPASLAGMRTKSGPDDEEQEVFKAILGASGTGSIFGKF